MRLPYRASLLALALLAACLLSPAAVTTEPPDARPASTPRPGGGGAGSYEKFVGELLQTAADDAGPAEKPRVTRGMSHQEEAIVRQAQLLDNAGGWAGAAGLAAGLMLWTAERVQDKSAQSVLDHNYFRVQAWRAQLPPGSRGEDVMMLADAETGKLVACFTKGFWKSHRDVIRGEYPRDKYEFKIGGELFINYTHLPPLGDADAEFARKVFRKSARPLIDSVEDMKEQSEKDRLSGPRPPTFEGDRGPQPMTNPYPTPAPDDTLDLRYTPGMMERDVRLMKGMARAFAEYEERRRGDDGPGQIGGVALTGATRFGEGATPEALYLSRGRLFARVGGKDLPVEGVDPAEFSVLLRGTALYERAPVLSIGSEPSARAGYQKVSYEGGVRNTSVGEAMLKADLKLKGLLAAIGMGAGGASAGGVQEFLWTFPGVEGLQWVRLWLTGGEVSFARAGERLVADSPRMTLRYELAVRESPAADAETERFASEFNRKWPEVAAAVPEFRRLERLGVASALARWAASSGCLISPELWVVPFEDGRTPEYVPAYFSVGASGLATYSGGVSLLGEGATPPRLGLLLPLAAAKSSSPGGDLVPSRKGYAVLAAAVVGVLFLSAAFGLLARGAFAPLKGRALFARSLKIWAALLALLFLADVLVSELVNAGVTGPFDSEFLCVLTVLALPAVLLRVALGRGGGRARTGAARAWLLLPALGLCASLTLAAVSAGVNMILLSGVGVSLARLRVANFVAAPVEVAARPFASSVAGRVQAVPQSVWRATRYRFFLPDEEDRFDVRPSPFGGQDAIVLPVPDITLGPTGAPLNLSVVRSPGFTSKRVVMSVTGGPPY